MKENCITGEESGNVDRLAVSYHCDGPKDSDFLLIGPSAADSEHSKTTMHLPQCSCLLGIQGRRWMPRQAMPSRKSVLSAHERTTLRTEDVWDCCTPTREKQLASVHVKTTTQLLNCSPLSSEDLLLLNASLQFRTMGRRRWESLQWYSSNPNVFDTFSKNIELNKESNN